MATRSERVPFVDLARAGAVLFMIQGHTLQALLRPAQQESLWFYWWLYLRGLTSCTFLLLSGLSFGLATSRHWADYLAPSPRLKKRLSRIGLLLVLGYVLRIPIRPLSNWSQVTASQWQAFVAVDILQLVAVSLLGLQALAWLARTPRRLAAGAAGTAGLIVLLTPIAWRVDWAAHVPVTLAAYCSGLTGSLFPLFPWAAYLFLGAALGLCAAENWRMLKRPAVLLLLSGIGLVAAGVTLDHVPLSPYGPIDFWATSPNLFLVKAGSVLLLLAWAAHATRAVESLPKVVVVLSRESLTIYVVHLAVIYGSIWNSGLAQRIGAHLGLAPTIGWAITLMSAMTLMAWVWHECKQRAHPVSVTIRVMGAAALLYVIA